MFEFVDREGLIDHVDPVQFTLRLLVPPGSALLATTRRSARTWAPLSSGRSSTAGPIPTRGWTPLQRRRRRIVEAAAEAHADEAATFYRVKALVDATAGPAARVSPPALRARPAASTAADRAWFC